MFNIYLHKPITSSNKHLCLREKEHLTSLLHDCYVHVEVSETLPMFWTKIAPTVIVKKQCVLEA